MIKLKTLCQNYREENFWLAGSTKETTERAFRYLVECVGNKEIDRLNYEDCQHYKGWLLRTGRSKTTANMYLRSIGPVLSWAIRLQLIETSPMKGVSQFRTTKKPIRIYEPEDFFRMLKAARTDQWRAILLTGYSTGLRRGEILNLTKDNIREGFVWVEEKRDTSKTWPWSPKTCESRKVPLVEPLREILDRLDCFYPVLKPQRYLALLKLKASGLLAERVRKCPVQNFRRTFVNIQKRAFGRQVGDFHMLRKTYTTRMTEYLPNHFVMQLVGHNNLKTMTYYTAARRSYWKVAEQAALQALKMAPVACSVAKKEVQTAEGQWAVADLNC